MKKLAPKEISQLLSAWSNGDQEALDKLTPLVYEELHRIAGRYMRRENPGHTLQTSALVNEAYIKLIDQKNVQWQNRAHFFGIAAQLMRRILVDHARKRARVRRGAGATKLSLNETAIVAQSRDTEFILIDNALKNLARIDPSKSRIVEMRFFAGLTTEEIAEVEKVSPSTIEREWRKAKAWLYREINQ
ncbi:MAG TPA: sigma-70 family RNA polymerase sigma factor [Acidobacteriota bacterium]|nr:sigma-70 family RNA polymerase sigma factor [Acidobacteriota bacterium]